MGFGENASGYRLELPSGTQPHSITHRRETQREVFENTGAIMTEDDCVERPLFGGALSSVFPLRFQDVSNIREVPDHQEVFVDPARDESLIFELLDLKHDVQDNGSATWFLQDLVTEQDAEGSKVLQFCLFGSVTADREEHGDAKGQEGEEDGEACLFSGNEASEDEDSDAHDSTQTEPEEIPPREGFLHGMMASRSNLIELCVI
ncbi:hypothetical protein NE237_021714 [Protea cynaroides]|uniref:Ran guanine nucleotide release factor n=1 Tax=Protea cynaroides TaxID=273540 RepID=A0A9Q0K2V5_9MAGN|nr:hypothetical protein NE237_021714 [Protea cynaroides]